MVAATAEAEEGMETVTAVGTAMGMVTVMEMEMEAADRLVAVRVGVAEPVRARGAQVQALVGRHELALEVAA